MTERDAEASMSKSAGHAQERIDIFARNVKAQRARRGLSQSQVGKLSGIHATEISRIERGLRDPRISTLIRLARALGMPPSRLLDGV
jgi:transcriptional regulator with XRE-family HTH domain